MSVLKSLGSSFAKKVLRAHNLESSFAKKVVRAQNPGSSFAKKVVRAHEESQNRFLPKVVSIRVKVREWFG